MKSSVEMGMQALEEGRYQQAIAILEATTRVTPDDPAVWLTLARAYQAAGQTPKAVAAYQLVLASQPPEAIVAEAERGLAAIQHEAKEQIVEAMRPVCGSCGAMLPATRAARPWCLCGWNTRTPPVIGRQIYLADVFAYAAQRGVVIAFKRREDVFLAGKGQLRIQGLGTKSYPVDPRLALGIRERMAVILQDELRPVGVEGGADGLFRERSLDQVQGGGRYFGWRQLVARLSEVEGVDVSMRAPDTSLAGVLAAAGVLTPSQAHDIRKARLPEESVGQAIVRMGLLTPDELITGAVGKARIGPQPVRDHADRLGERLIAEGLLERRQLKHVLFLQSQFPRPLGELLVEARLAAPGDVQDAVERQAPPPARLPAADALSELLVASRLLSRTQVQQLDAEVRRLGAADLEDILRQRHLVPDDQIDRMASWRRRKQELCHLGRERIGEVLVAQRAIASEALGQALMEQVDDPRPLGLLLVGSGRITPEQLVSALEEQDRRRNRQAWHDEDDVALGTRPLDASGAVNLARATTRALSRVLVGDEPPRRRPRRGGAAGREGGRLRSATPWRLLAFAALMAALAATGAGLLAGRAASHKSPPAGQVERR